jgi:hypothetical protein
MLMILNLIFLLVFLGVYTVYITLYFYLLDNLNKFVSYVNIINKNTTTTDPKKNFFSYRRRQSTYT